MPYQVMTPDGTTVCSTAQEVRQAVDEHLRDHPDDVDFGRVVIEEIGEGRTGVGVQLTPQEFFWSGGRPENKCTRRVAR